MRSKPEEEEQELNSPAAQEMAEVPGRRQPAWITNSSRDRLVTTGRLGRSHISPSLTNVRQPYTDVVSQSSSRRSGTSTGSSSSSLSSSEDSTNLSDLQHVRTLRGRAQNRPSITTVGLGARFHRQRNLSEESDEDDGPSSSEATLTVISHEYESLGSDGGGQEGNGEILERPQTSEEDYEMADISQAAPAPIYPPGLPLPPPPLPPRSYSSAASHPHQVSSLQTPHPTPPPPSGASPFASIINGVKQALGASSASSRNLTSSDSPPEHHQQEQPESSQQRERDTFVRRIAENNPIVLAEEIVRRGDKIDKYKSELEDKSRMIKASEAREHSLGKQLQILEAQMEELRTELSNSRAFVETEDAGDVESVIEGLVAINSAIDTLAFQIVTTSLPTCLDTNRFRTADKALVQNAYEHFINLAKGAHAYRATSQDFLLPAVTATIVKTIEREIFKPFRMGLDAGTNHGLLKLHKLICKTEPQDRSARWRSITYERCTSSTDQSDNEHCEMLTNDILTAFISLVTLVLPSSARQSAAELDLSKWAQPLYEILLKAISWRSRTSKDYLSWDYIPILQPPSAWVKQRQEEGDGVVVALCGFGLLARRGIAEKDGQGRTKEGIKIEEKWLKDVEVTWENALNLRVDE